MEIQDLSLASLLADPFRVGTVWHYVGKNVERTITVLERGGDNFKAKFVSTEGREREVRGTVKNGTVSWLANDSTAIVGNIGFDHVGTITKDAQGPIIQFVASVDGVERHKFTARLRDVEIPARANPINEGDRKAAEMILSVGGRVRVRGFKNEIRDAADLPRERFSLSMIWLRGSQRVTDDNLSICRGCLSLDHLDLVGTKITDKGLAHFADCKNLNVLDLVSAPIGDVGIAHFKGCNKLGSLWLGNTKVTDKGLAVFSDCRNLNHLDLSGTTVTDAGLAQFASCQGIVRLFLGNTTVTDVGLANFASCKNLVYLDVRNTKVTKKGVADFRVTIPNCKIDQ